MPGVAGGALAPLPVRSAPNPRAPLPPPKKSLFKLCNLETYFSGPRLAILMLFFRVFYGSLLRSLFVSFSSSLLVSILSSQADPPTLKNLDFASTGARFTKNQGLGFEDALDGVLGLSWARFGCSWGLLGGSFGAFAGSRWHPEFSNFLFGLP